MTLEREGRAPLRRSTRVLVDAPTAGGRRDQRVLAEDIYRAAMGDLARGQFKLPTTRPRITFATHAAWYRDTIAKTHRGKVNEISMINNLIKSLGHFPLDELEEPTIEEWKALRATEVQPQTVNRELDVLKPLLAKAVPKYLEVSPAAKVKRFRVRRFAPVSVLTFSAEDAILRVATAEERAFVLLGLDALMRLGDVRRFNVAHDHGAYLEVVDPKTTEPYKVPISSRLRAALDAIAPTARTRGGYYFARKYRQRWAPIADGSSFQLFADLCDRALVPRGRAIGGITFHGLRHTGATRVTRKVGINVARRLGGWSSLRQLVRYDHPDAADFLRGVEAIGERPAAENVHAIETARDSRVRHSDRTARAAAGGKGGKSGV